MRKEMTEQYKKLQDGVRENAHRAWLAGLGTVSWVEDESKDLVEDGKKFFDGLVDRGKEFESRGKKELDKARKEAEKEVQGVRGKVEKSFDELSGQVDKQVTTVLHRMGIPTRDEIQTLTRRVEELSRRLEGQTTKTATVKRATYHVVTADEGWDVKLEGTTKPLANHATKDEAVDAARKLAGKNLPSMVVVHKMDGTIQNNYSYDQADA